MLAHVIASLFIATFIRSAFGFGEAMVAVPLLALMMPVEVAAPVAVLVSITVASIVVVQDFRHIKFQSVGWLILATLAGTPLGLLLLGVIAGSTIKIVLALVIVGFSSYSLLHRRRAVLENDRLAWLFGFGAGILGGTYGMNGPPLVVYGTLRGWSPQHFRATLQGYFLPASLLVMGGYWASGLWTPAVTHHYLTALPAVVLAIFLGRVVNQRMQGPIFLRCVHALLISVGTLLLFQTLTRR